MGGRKLKKKPVLVVDPEELAQAHQAFQQGAAEQLGDYEPEQRPRASVSLFGLAPMSEDDEADLAAPPPFPLNDDDEEEFEEAEAPAPEKVLSLTRLSQPKAPRPSIFGTLPDASVQAASEPLPEHKSLPESEPLYDPAAHTPKRVEHPAPPPMPASEVPAPPRRPVHSDDEITSAFSHRDATPTAPVQPARPEQPIAPLSADLQPDPFAIPELATEPELDDAVASVTLFEEDEVAYAPPRPAPKPLAPMPSEQNSLRARLMREDVSMAKPKASLWQQFVGLIQRWYWALTGR